MTWKGPRDANARRFVFLAGGMLSWMVAAAPCTSHGQADGRSPAGVPRAAHFQITERPIGVRLQGFTATVGPFGNTLVRQGGGFEPVVHRTRFIALEDSERRIVVDPRALSAGDMRREGFYDGAEVRVYRIENGRFGLVRQDRVATGGCAMSGWTPVLADGWLVDPSSTSFTFRWDSSFRPQVDYFFTVVAVDAAGRVSAPAKAVRVRWGGGTGGAPVENRLSRWATKRTSPPGTGSGDPVAPANLRASMIGEDRVLLQWDPGSRSALAGYNILRSDTPPEAHRGYFLELSRSHVDARERIKAGDLVIVSKRLFSASREKDLSNRAWGSEAARRNLLPGLIDFFPDEDPGRTWQLVAHPPGSPVVDPGETFLRVRLASGERVRLAGYNYAGTAQSFYDVLETRPYRFEVWMRKLGAGSARFFVSGFYERDAQQIPGFALSASEDWRRLEATFEPKVIHTGDQPGQMGIELTGPGVFDIDNFRVFRADTKFLDFLPWEAEALRGSGMRALRTHGLIKTRTRTYDLAQLTNPGGVTEGTPRANTLPQILEAFERLGVEPWLQVEYHLAPFEWLGLIEYLAAPYVPGSDTPLGKPWAYKRYRQGRAAPWTDAFQRIYLELGNETWNRLFEPWTFPAMRDAVTGRHYSSGEVYGLFQEHVIGILRSSPYWSAAGLDQKVRFVLGGRDGNDEFNAGAAMQSPSSHYLTVGAYIGGWESGRRIPTPTAADLFEVLQHVTRTGIPAAGRVAAIARRVSIGRTHALGVGTYEGGPGYQLHGLNNAVVSPAQAHDQELAMKSVAAGTATLDAFLARAALGFELQNFFAFGPGRYWRSHTAWHEGARPHPPWSLLALFNNHGGGEMLDVVQRSEARRHLWRLAGNPEARPSPAIAVYATRSGSRYTIVVASRRMPGHPDAGSDGHTPLTLDLPFEHADRLTLLTLHGNAESSLVRGDNVDVLELPLAAPWRGRRLVLGDGAGAFPRGMPPGTSAFFVFEGVRSMPAARSSAAAGHLQRQ